MLMGRRGRPGSDMRTLLLLMLMAMLPSAGALELSSRHHPVGVGVPETMKLSEGMKADDQGQLACSTCHGVENLEKRKREDIEEIRRRHADDFLRGGPWKKLDDFCFQCHDEQPYQRLNIHVQLDEQGKPREENCKYCHREVPDRKHPPKRGDLKLRLPVERICLGCHLNTPHLNAVEHSRKPEEEMRKRMAEAEKTHRIILPLGEQGQVSCVTCHSPHQKGVIDPGHPAGRQVAERPVEDGPDYQPSRWSPIYRADKEARLVELERTLGQPVNLDYRRLVGEVLMRLPAADGSLCRACHQFND